MKMLIVKVPTVEYVEHLKALGVPILVIYQRFSHTSQLVNQYKL